MSCKKDESRQIMQLDAADSVEADEFVNKHSDD